MQDEINAGFKITPAIGGAALSGFTLNEWVALATLIYVLLQSGLLLPKYWAMLRRWSATK
jgi:hypothetical protein